MSIERDLSRIYATMKTCEEQNLAFSEKHGGFETEIGYAFRNRAGAYEIAAAWLLDILHEAANDENVIRMQRAMNEVRSQILDARDPARERAEQEEAEEARIAAEADSRFVGEE